MIAVMHETQCPIYQQQSYVTVHLIYVYIYNKKSVVDRNKFIMNKLIFISFLRKAENGAHSIVNTEYL